MRPIQPRLARSFRFLGVHFAVLCLSMVSGHVCAQTGPTLPGGPEFPNPSNPTPAEVNKPVVPGETAADAPEAPAERVELLPAPRVVRPGHGTTRYNVGIAVSEALLNDIAAGVRAETNAVCDRVLGANVRGSQQTRAETRIDCRRNYETAELFVVLNSFTNANTVGYRPDAAVSTEGCHRAELIKRVFFDGSRLTTKPPEGYVRARNLNRGIVTPFAGVPVLGPIANEFALRQTERTRPAAETIAASRLSQRVVPEFNMSVDNALRDVNDNLRTGIRSWLSDQRVFPDDVRTSSSDNELRFRLRFGSEAEVETPDRRLFGRNGSVLLHESAVAAFARRWSLGGLTLTDRQLEKLSGGASEGDTDLTTPQLYSIVFDTTDPVQARFDAERSELILRIEIRPVLGGSLGLQQVRLPVTARVAGDRVRLDFGAAVVTPADGSASGPQQTLIAEQISSKLTSLSIPSSYQVAVPRGQSVTPRVSQVDASNGWLLISVD